MQENLVIVESPAKAKTIEKFLGKEFVVKSSFGHIRDLPKKELSIDIESGFVPTYEIPKEKSKLVAELSKAAAAAKTLGAKKLFIPAIPSRETVAFYFASGCRDAQVIIPDFLDTDEDRCLERPL